MINFEGGAIPEEYHNAYLVDRVNTTTTVWLGLTVACAQCHDHKYDPITQKDFYQLYAFFNNVPENGLDGNYGNADPVLKFPTPEEGASRAQLRSRITAAETKLKEIESELPPAQAAWEEDLRGKFSDATLGGPLFNPGWRPASELLEGPRYGTRIGDRVAQAAEIARLVEDPRFGLVAIPPDQRTTQQADELRHYRAAARAV